jgi:CheY-like chemotaxis protein
MKLNFDKVMDNPRSNDSASKTRVKVLLVDDEAVNLTGLAGLLADDYEVLKATSGAEGLEIVNQNQDIRVVISDHIMPGMNGIEFLTHLEQTNSNATRILLTGFAALDNVMAAINQAGIYRFLTKPIDPDGFTKAIADAVRIAHERALNRHYINQFKEIIYPHQLNKISEFETIESTMPIGEKKAIVIAFDIQESSKIPEDVRFDFFDSVIKSCHRFLNENYNAEKLIANGFMIKEVGDGFLCSVGYPFTSPENNQDCALKVAEEFYRLFNIQRRDFFPDKKIFCSIGVALGSLIGRFPRIGPKHYDMFGDAIVKAVRYENMRKVLFARNILPVGNIIFVQSELIDQCSPDVKQRYKKLDMGNITVRDDGSTHLYYQLFDDYDVSTEQEAG